MKHYYHFFGVDVSKKTVDITYICNQTVIHRQFTNDADGMKLLIQWLEELAIDHSQTLFCMEATGLYCFTLTHFLGRHSIDVWIEHAVQIKKASGLARGKNDKIDSQRIAQYAVKNQDLIRLWKPADITLQKIKNLISVRERLVITQKRLLVPIQEFKDVGDMQMAKMLEKTIKNSLTAIDKDLRKIEENIINIINEDDNLKQLYKLITSVVGIGFVTAVNLIIHTNAFTKLNDVRKLACYCGVAPFEYKSGTSIRGRTKVHHMCNRKLKCNLHMASLAAIKFDVDLKAYYNRKVAEGKNKMSVLNAVRNKLLARVVAVVNKRQEYVKKSA